MMRFLAVALVLIFLVSWGDIKNGGGGVRLEAPKGSCHT